MPARNADPAGVGAAAGTAGDVDPPPGRGRALLEIGTAAAVSIALAVTWLSLWKADLRVPFNYDGDALVVGMWIKAAIEHGLGATNPDLGAPGVLELHDFAQADTLHIVLVKMLSGLTRDWALVCNLYFLLGFPLITGTALAVLRHFRVRFGPALVVSLLYAFLPSRLIKGESHLFLGMFFQVPLGILVVLWVCHPQPPLVRDRERKPPRRWRLPGLDLRRPRSIAALALCLVVSLTGFYYAFFTGCLLIAGGIWASIERRTAANAVAGVALAGIIVLGLGAQALPSLVYQARHGPNPEVARRDPYESELYGMRIAQLVLPASGHRIAALRRLKARYDATAPLGGESSTTSLGAVGALGFLGLLGVVALRPRRERRRQDLVRPLAVLNLGALLIATLGGFGAVFAYLVTPQIRTYARMNVVVAFLALFAVALVLDRLARRFPRWARPMLALALGLGMLDQVTPAMVRPYAQTKAAYAAHAQAIHRIQATAPPRAMIFQLPYLGFPETPGGHWRTDYESLRPYLHARGLRWSYPTMGGRSGDAWTRQVAAQPPARMVETLADAGFQGILIDRRGYAPGDTEVEAALGRLLEAPPLAGADGRYAYFSLDEFGRRAHQSLSPEERERRRELALHPVVIVWSQGFYGSEGAGAGVGSWRWCPGTCEMVIENAGRAARAVRIAATLAAGAPPAQLTIAGSLVSQEIALPDDRGTRVSWTVKVPPGRHVHQLRSQGRPVVAPRDPRRMVWRVQDVSIEPPDTAVRDLR
jgi:phosphoglycerol transferase